MAYSVKADILKQLPEKQLAQLTDDTNGTTVDDSIVTAMIAKADNQINTYCRGKSDLPFNTTTTPRINDWSVSLAIWNLYKRRVNISIPEPVEADYNDVIEELKSVRDGKILLNDPDSPANTANFYKGSDNDTSETGDLFTDKADGTGSIDSYYNGPY